MSYVQASRLCALNSPLGRDAFLLVSMHGHEGVSELFRFTTELVSENHEIAMDEIVGKPVSLRLQLADGGQRFFHGVVATFEQAGRDQRLSVYRAEIRPWLWVLTRRADCRIFQHMTVPKIVSEVFERAGFRDFELRLQGSYGEREFCVQYRETDFAFVSRLLEAEGIFYYFEHEEGRHVLVLCDAPASVSDCPDQAEAFYAGDTGGNDQRDEIRHWRAQRTLHPGRQALKDYNFEDPGNALSVDTKSTLSIGDNSGLEIYDHHASDYGDAGGGEARSRVRMEEMEAAAFRVQGDGTCRAFSPGLAFTLRGHFRADADGKKFMLLTVTHRLSQSGYETGQAEDTRYDNVFTCVPIEAPYRPERVTTLPRITGPQTAMVVGAAGEEIDVDEFGRVWLQFHWDREGKRDDKSSCRVRVTQAWAGNSFGFVAHPRIGDEVIVEFLEGDPDKPIITGCVYNKRTMPPYALPGNKTQSGLKSRSSKGGSPSNFNELRFEDMKGSEEVYIQAEKNKTVLVKNDRSENVGHDETITIGNNRTETVGNNEIITIQGNRVETVVKQEQVTIEQNRSHTVNLNDMHNVKMNHKVDVGLNQATSIGASETVKVGKMSNELVGLVKTTSVGGAYALTVGGAMNVAVGLASLEEVGLIKKIIAGSSIELICGGSSLKLDSSGKVTIKGSEFEFLSSGPTKITGDPIDLN